MEKSNIYISIILLSIIGLGVLSYRVINKEDETTEVDPKYQYQIRESRIVSYEGGEKRWDILAMKVLEPKKNRDDKESITILEEIERGLLFNGGEVEYELDADKIIYYKESKNVDLEGNVILRQLSGEVIRGERLNWVESKQELTSNTDVWIEMKDGTIHSKRMNMDLDNDIIDFSGGVEVEFDIGGADDEG